MNPGDLYNNPPRGDPGYTSPTRQPFPMAPGQSIPNPYDHHPLSPPPHVGQGQQQIHHSQSQHFPPPPPAPAPSQVNQSYGDPFLDSSHVGQVGGGGQGGWNQQEGSRHYQSYPLLPSSPPPDNITTGRPSLNPAQYSSSSSSNNGIGYPQTQIPPNVLSPSRSNLPLDNNNRTRFDSNPSFGAYGLSDNRLTSPPPLLPHQSSDSSNLYPSYPPNININNNGIGGGRQSFQGGLRDDDFNDSQPLLNHARTSFGNTGLPGIAGAPGGGGGGYQLHDNGAGDMGLLGGNLSNGNGNAGGYQNGSMGNGYGGYGGHGQYGTSMGTGEDEENVHYGPVPTRVVRRNKTQKKVK